MIDLTFLTEEEQEAIRDVLNRDALLKKVEEQRVQNLQRTVSDQLLLRFLTGDWFYETKQRRHQDRIHGCDIIRASMRHSLRRPTNEEQCWTVMPPDVFCSENPERSSPRVLGGPNPEPLVQPRTDRCENKTVLETGPDPPKLLLHSPSKRRNPFNSKAKQDEGWLDGAWAERGAGDPAAHDNDSELCEMGLKNTLKPHHVVAEQNSGKTVYPTPPPDDSQMEELENGMPETRLSYPESLESSYRSVSPKTTNDQKEEEKAKKEEAAENENLLRIPAHPPIIKQHKTAEVKMLHLTALQRISFEDTETSALFPRRQCHLENSPSRKTLIMEDLNDEDKCKAAMTDSHITQMSAGATNSSPELKMNQEVAGEGSPWTGYGDSFRANPILICEETDESLENSLTDITPEEDPGTPGPHERPFSSTPEEKGTTSVMKLKHFWDKENPGPGITPATAKSRSALPTSSDSRAELEGAPQASERIMAGVQTLQKLSDPGPETSSVRTLTSDLEHLPTESEERSRSPAKQHLRSAHHHEDDVRRSPSKTCHPKVLPRDSSPASGSPLKTFPIDIDSHNKANKQHEDKSIPSPRHMKSAPHGSKTMVAGHGTEVSPRSGPEQFKALTVQLNESTSSKEMTDSCSFLARSFTPHNLQHYLGPLEKTHSPPFTEDHISAESQDVLRLESTCSQPAICSPSIISSPGRNRNESNPEVSGPPSSRTWIALRSSSAPSCEQMRSSVSVPECLQDQTDSDGTFETIVSFRRRNTSSSTSNISCSSGMASMVSVSGSLSSLDAPDCPGVQGNIQFAVNYIQKLEEFHVFVVLCRGLAMADIKKSRPDPYVKCYLLPDKTKLGKRKTSVKKKTLNPTYNEILRFQVVMEVLKTQCLSVSVWHNDTFGRNIFLGGVDLDLSDWDFSNTQINDYALKAGASEPTPLLHLTDSRGQMRVALRFLPQTSHTNRRMEAGEVQIWIKDCRNLPPGRGILLHPFVKCAVLPDTSRKSRQKTRVVKRTTSPMFNHTMVYDGFRPEDLREACAEITVWDHDRLNSHYIGGLRLGLGTGQSYGMEVSWMDSSPEEAALWRRMLQAHGEWVESILPLRMLLMAKIM